MMQILGALLVRLEVCIEVARSNINQLGICPNLTCLPNLGITPSNPFFQKIRD